MKAISDARTRRFHRVGSLFRAPFFVEFVFPYFLCIAIYNWLFAIRFLNQDIVMGGDTQLI